MLHLEKVEEALKYADADIADMKAEYKKRRNFIHSSFEEMGIPCIYPDGAFYAFADVSKFGMTSKEFALKLLDEQNVACVPGTAFGPCGEGFIRCSYATSMDEIKEAMVRVARFVKALKV